MPSALPAKLKTVDIQRFAHRAAQLEKVRPIVTYWCEYYILQHILERQLHATDEECTQYAIQLMDKLEQYKSANASNDAVIDDLAAKAYVEQFALATFERADGSQRANTVTAQTADTFQAAITFMDLLSIWGRLESEIVAKKKYAKYHAVRIARAIKAGEDPNASNPVVEPPAPVDAELEDGLEAELQNLQRPNDAGVYQPPTVVSMPESRIHHDLGATPSGSIEERSREAQPDVSPLEGPQDASSRTGSIGGGYFPAVPSSASNAETTDPQAQITSPSAPSNLADFYNAPQPPAPGNVDLGPGSPNRPSAPTPNHMLAQPPTFTSPPPVFARPPPGPPPLAQPVHTAPPPGSYKTDDDAVLAAQKHAKWAISALNFEDVGTAVKELRLALQSLGAS